MTCRPSIIFPSSSYNFPLASSVLASVNTLGMFLPESLGTGISSSCNRLVYFLTSFRSLFIHLAVKSSTITISRAKKSPSLSSQKLPHLLELSSWHLPLCNTFQSLLNHGVCCLSPPEWKLYESRNFCFLLLYFLLSEHCPAYGKHLANICWISYHMQDKRQTSKLIK